MEGATRVFAGEFSRADLTVQDGTTAAPPWIVTPGGAWCRLLFLAGALTEFEESTDTLRCRVADPTGVFDLVMGTKNSSPAKVLAKLPVPSFVTVTGQAFLYRKNGNAVLSIRPEQVQLVDRAVRDQYVLMTAHATLRRLEQMHLALKGVCSDEQYLTAARHYAVTSSLLRDLATMTESAIQSIRSEDAPVTGIVDVRVLIMELISAPSGHHGIAVAEVIETAGIHGIPQEEVLAAIESLIVDDECYQPQKGFVKPL